MPCIHHFRLICTIIICTIIVFIIIIIIINLHPTNPKKNDKYHRRHDHTSFIILCIIFASSLHLTGISLRSVALSRVEKCIIIIISIIIKYQHHHHQKHLCTCQAVLGVAEHFSKMKLQLSQVRSARSSAL